MSEIVAIGESPVLDGFALVGVRVARAATADDALRAWRSLGDDVGLVLLTPLVASQLSAELGTRSDVLTVVSP